MERTKYSSYSRDSVVTEDYEKLANSLLSMTTDSETREKMESILYEGGFNEFAITTGELAHSNPSTERERRAHYAYLLANNPSTFDTITAGSTPLLHGTGSSALANILKHGLNSVDESVRKGIEVVTGEEWSRRDGKRNFISFTDSLAVAIHYAHDKIYDGSECSGEFGVILGIDSSQSKELRQTTVYSQLPEFAVRDNVPIEYIKFICVPPERVEFVRKMVGDKPIKVAAMDIQDPFYSKYYYDYGNGYLYDNGASDYIEQVKAEKIIREEKSFTKNDVRKLTFGRRLSKMMETLGINNLFKLNNPKGKEGDFDAR